MRCGVSVRHARKSQGARNAHTSSSAECPGKIRFPHERGPPPATMTKDDIQLLYEYDRWANNRVLQAVTALSARAVHARSGRQLSFRARHARAHRRGRVGLGKEPSPDSAFLA